MDLLTGGGVNHFSLEKLHSMLQLSHSEFQWLVATLFAAIGSTIVYNIIKFRILGDNAPDKWSWRILPLWCLLWVNKVSLFIGCVLVIWYLYRLQQHST